MASKPTKIPVRSVKSVGPKEVNQQKRKVRQEVITLALMIGDAAAAAYATQAIRDR